MYKGMTVYVREYYEYQDGPPQREIVTQIHYGKRIKEILQEENCHSIEDLLRKLGLEKHIREKLSNPSQVVIF